MVLLALLLHSFAFSAAAPVKKPVVPPPPPYKNGSLECRASGKGIYEAFNTDTQRWIGSKGNGSTSGDCKIAISHQGKGSVCAWNGSYWQPYSKTTGKHFGADDTGWDTLSDCNNVVAGDVGGVVCGWDGDSTYIPTFTSDGSPVDSSGLGFGDLDECLTATKAAVNSTVCAWNGGELVVYNLTTRAAVRSLGTDTPTCAKFTKQLGPQNPPPDGPAKWDPAGQKCMKGSAAATADDCANSPLSLAAWTGPDKATCAAYFTPGVLIANLSATDRCVAAARYYDPDAKAFASTRTVNIAGVSTPLIEAILETPEFGVVPPEVFKKYPTKTIAASLVERIHEMDEIDGNAAKPIFDYQANSIVAMAFQDTYIPLIQKNGFLNEHQVDHSGGALNPEKRASTEDALIHAALEAKYVTGVKNPANQVRPKYSFLTFLKDTDGDHNSTFYSQYGNVVAVFKDEVKVRSTFTSGDSLDGDDANVHAARAYTFQFRSATAIARLDTAYWETQIWGPLTFDDVDYFLVSCGDAADLTKSSLDKLKAAGKPIYRCVIPDDTSHFGKGKALFTPGAAVPVPAPKPVKK